MMQELSMNILDVAENSVRAGASLVEITIDEQPAEDLLTIEISDNGCGMSPEQLKNAADPFFTTRNTRKVGLGLPFFKMAAELAGGKMDIRSSIGKGTVITAYFVRSSIDLMPLGDINETICTLIHCNPQIDFIYRRRFEDSEMILDTREFRRILEGIELNDPKVSKFIRDFLAENTSDLFTGR
ncbi:MAG: sensor histidine kinase [Clostridiales bacterium]|jgi:anti-sigma regulatory factor (Ser/Thr protein kinase)|nr:sensor histidine kinase [Clostridiales bacterium]